MEKFINIKTYQLKSIFDDNEIKTKKRISIKGLGIVYVDIQSPEHPVNLNKNPNSEYVIHFPYFKSLLQKAVRRKNKMEALQACKIMIKIDIIKTIRRILIIMVEDVGCFEREFIELTWLTCQTKFTSLQCRWLLGLISKLCDYPYKHNCFGLNKCNNDEHQHYIYGCRSKDLDVAMKVRASYGGLRSDIKMLNEIHSSIYSLNPELMSVQLIESIPNFKYENRQPYLAAVDHHICKIHIILAKKLNVDPEKIKDKIWKLRSSTNAREDPNLENDKKMQILDSEAWKILDGYFFIHSFLR